MKGFGGVDCELHEMKGFVTTGMGMLHALHTFTKCKKKTPTSFQSRALSDQGKKPCRGILDLEYRTSNGNYTFSLSKFYKTLDFMVFV
jgi:hypothetical protein